MTVSARPANDLLVAANIGMVDMREGMPVRAGTYPYEGDDLVTGWHTHDLHQIEYAFQGVVEVETEAAHYLLPPQQAVWIPAGLAHRTTLKRVRTVSVFFDPEMVPSVDGRARILAAAPVIREMIVYGVRWPINRPASDPVADAFFEALAQLTHDWLDHETPLCLPTSTDPVVAAVMAHTNAHLDEVTARHVCRAVGVSERTLRRAFSAATGMTWRQYLLESRLLRAMALLAETGPTVLDVATSVGFDSVSAFTRAFGRYTGETPTAYRRRVTAASVGS
jgi:AraC-like DNA-binding protein